MPNYFRLNGEREADLGRGRVGGLEELVAVDGSAEGVGRDPRALEQALLSSIQLHWFRQTAINYGDLKRRFPTGDPRN